MFVLKNALRFYGPVRDRSIRWLTCIDPGR